MPSQTPAIFQTCHIWNVTHVHSVTFFQKWLWKNSRNARWYITMTTGTATSTVFMVIYHRTLLFYFGTLWISACQAKQHWKCFFETWHIMWVVIPILKPSKRLLQAGGHIFKRDELWTPSTHRSLIELLSHTWQWCKKSTIQCGGSGLEFPMHFEQEERHFLTFDWRISWHINDPLLTATAAKLAHHTFPTAPKFKKVRAPHLKRKSSELGNVCRASQFNFQQKCHWNQKNPKSQRNIKSHPGAFFNLEDYSQLIDLFLEQPWAFDFDDQKLWLKFTLKLGFLCSKFPQYEFQMRGGYYGPFLFIKVSLLPRKSF